VSPRYDIDLGTQTLKTFTKISMNVANTCAKFHWNPSIKYRDIWWHAK